MIAGYFSSNSLAAETCTVPKDTIRIDRLLKDDANEKALVFAEECLDSTRKEDGRATLDSAPFLVRVGKAKMALGDPDSAEAALVAAILLFNAAPSNSFGSRSKLVNAMGELAKIYKSTQQHSKVISTQTVYVGLLEKEGWHVFSALLAWQDIGDAHLALGELPAAESAYQNAIGKIDRVPEFLRKLTSDTYRHLGRLYRTQERHRKSEMVLKTGLGRTEGQFGTDNVNTALYYEALGWTYYHQFRREDAKAMTDLALAYFDGWGRNDSDAPVGTFVLKARLVESEPNGAADAQQLLTEALAIRKAVNGQGSEAHADGLLDLAEHYLKVGNFIRAEESSKEALQIYELQREQNILSVGRSHFFLGQALSGQGKPAKAIPHALRCLQIWRNSLPPYHSKLGEVLTLLSKLQQSMGQTTALQETQHRIARFEEARAEFLRKDN